MGQYGGRKAQGRREEMQVTIIDYMMKILAKERYASLYPNDPQAALRGFASFMGYFGQVGCSGAQ